MKFIIFLFIVVQIAGIFAAAVSNSAANHHLDHKRTGVQSLAPMSKADMTLAAININLLRSHKVQDACYYNAPYGCSNGHCWRTCGTPGSGQWCWLAANNGAGDWLKCTTFQQCNIQGAYGCGRNCKPNSKMGCGCSC